MDISSCTSIGTLNSAVRTVKLLNRDACVCTNPSKDTFKDTLNDTLQKTQHNASIDTLIDTCIDTLKDTLKDTLHDASKDTLKDASKDTLKDTTKDTLKDISHHYIKHLRNMVPARSNVFRQQFGIWSTFSVLVVQPALGVFARATLPLFRSSQEGEYLFRFQSQRQFF